MGPNRILPMILSMTAFGSGTARHDDTQLTIELRGVNSRFLDLHFKLPDEYRHTESRLRELLSARLLRGKVEIRLASQGARSDAARIPDMAALEALARQLAQVRSILPDTPAPRLQEVLQWLGGQAEQADPGEREQAQLALTLEAAETALSQFVQAREREGARLAEVVMGCADTIATILDGLEPQLPGIQDDYRQKLQARLQESVAQAFPGGFAHIGGQELSERLASEANLFALRIDVAEEIARLRSHLAELRHLLQHGASEDARGKRTSAGKRLDFLFQEMNREANTLGSKSGALIMTRAAMDLKLQIEQMREQAANFE